MKSLTKTEIEHLHTGARFLGCAVDPQWARDQLERTLGQMRDSAAAPKLMAVGEFDDDETLLAVGYVNRGLSTTELRPVGDEFVTSVKLVEERLGKPIAGLFPLAGAGINPLVPVLAGMQLDLPVVDVDPQGRVFPLLYQSVLTLAKLPVGPVGATGPTGESALLDVTEPRRAERLVRALAGEFGGWSATALYPIQARDLAEHGIIGTISLLIRAGEILDRDVVAEAKHAALRRVFDVRYIIRGRIIDVTGLSYSPTADQPDLPTSIVLLDLQQGRILQLEFQNEFLLFMVDGAVQAQIPDIITLLHPGSGTVAGLEDLWAGNVLDVVVVANDAKWYSASGKRLARAAAEHLFSREADL
jgi:DUF917 family protein